MSNEGVARGLAGIVVAQSRMSFIDGEKGELIYRGYDIHELTKKATFEDVVHLLWYGEAPTKAQSQQLREALAAEAQLPVEVVEILRSGARRATPMEALRTAVSALAYSDSNKDDDGRDATLRRALRIQAKIPFIVTAFHRLRTWSEPLRPDPSLSIAGNFLLTLTGKRPDKVAERVLDRCLILHADHGFNASTFTARVVMSTRSDLYSAITAAIGSLKGPLHGGANTAVMKMLQEIGDASRAEAAIDKLLGAGERIMGFGHRVYKGDDPRATWLRKMSAELGESTGNKTWFALSERIESIVKQRKGLNCNVDFYSASVYHYLGIPGDLFTPIFAISRTAGWVGHAIEQIIDAALIRPRAEYVGPRGLTWPGA
ncbi:MAG: citrate synthase [Candidatus Schekmanbacteria bacterium]|nr:citrate synthase [Candidatus Schekmanbacteria bacterium]